MKHVCDLHLHSSASDGQYSPSEVVSLAKERGLEVIALTDHDTVGGVHEALRAGREAGIRVLPGIEMSAREYKTFHILGYCFDPDDPKFLEELDGLQEGRDQRGERITAYLHEKGIPISYEEVRAKALGGMIGRPHFAAVMFEHGYVSNYRDAFNLYLDTDEFHERVEDKPPVRECVETIRNAGGRVSLAHPWQIGLDDDALDRQVRELVEMGLDAIECFYPKHTPEQTAYYLSLTEKYGLHVTGGSDFHGEKVKPEVHMVSLEMELDWLLNG